MTITLTRLYDDYDAACKAVRDLEAAGIPRDDISMVASNAEGRYSDEQSRSGGPAGNRVDRDRDGTDDRAEGAATGAGIGAALGGTAGLLAGLGLLAIPGLGPVVAVGWLASTALGAAAGGAAGGLVGALTQGGVDEEDAHVYAEGVRRGGTLVTARVPETDRVRVESILDRSAVNIRDRAEAYRDAGWEGFNPSAAPYTADEVRRERELYRNMGPTSGTPGANRI
jgi:hypothetical protein